MIRKGLKLNIQLSLGYSDIVEVSTCSELMQELVKKKFSHLILDIILSDGSTLEVIPNIRRVYPDLQILVFSMQPPEIYGEALKVYGINYYLSKSVGEEEMLKILEKFLHNETPERNTSIQHHGNPFNTLAPRELEILHYVLKGIGTKDIADTLNLKMNSISPSRPASLKRPMPGTSKN
ncbi:MAG: response regulator transcription factor [Chitinophagaceae bacterium]|nr:response regulator transcription factor [Chitinophagaceae bacterium]